MAQKRDRFFALMGALLFLLSASALTIAVVYDSVTNKSDTPTTDTNQQSTCDITQTSAGAEKLPSDFKATAETPKTLQSEDLTVGTGAAAKPGDCLQMKYYGTLASSGKVFDENYDKSTALQLQLGKGQVIPGWDQGLVGMKAGGVRRLVIPAELAYGATGQGDIPANATLVFLVKLVAIK
jgi:peptidylprolyl isomerase